MLALTYVVQGEADDEGPKMKTLLHLNALMRITTVSLMYVNIMMDESSMMAMMETSVTYNFIWKNEAIRLGFALEKWDSYMKVVNL